MGSYAERDLMTSPKRAELRALRCGRRRKLGAIWQGSEGLKQPLDGGPAVTLSLVWFESLA
jgi:hypothetical protein